MSQNKERRAARLAAVQALYQLELSGKSVPEVSAEFEVYWPNREVEHITFEAFDVELFRDILSGIVREQRSIDAAIHEALVGGWPLKRIEAVLRAILRAGAYELMFRKDVPLRVVISEYIDVAHCFYSDDEPGLINAVLDKVGRG
jgi:transcription antitermination protein NusB